MVSHAPIPRKRDPVVPNFGVLLCLCLHPLTQHDQIRRGNIGGGSGVFQGVNRAIAYCTNASRGLSTSFLSNSMTEILLFSVRRRFHDGCATYKIRQSCVLLSVRCLKIVAKIG